ncbi:MAG: starch-binding protein [Bacteroidota bacterium]
MRNFNMLWLLLLFSNLASAQVGIDLQYPNADQSITITYDASLGNAALAGSESIYMHSGVVLDKPTGTEWNNSVGNWGEDDGLGKMTSIGNNKWQITITPRNYYSVDLNQNIFRLATVFRNAEGTLVGKTADDRDIYIDIDPGFYVLFTNPDSESMFVKTSENFTLTAETPSTAEFKLYIDNQLKSTQSNTTSINYTYSFSGAGNHTAKIVAENGSVIREKTVSINVTDDSPIQELPSGMKDGINYIDDNTVLLNLLAPDKDFVHVTGTFNNWAIEDQYQMKRTPDGERFWIYIHNLTKGQDYIFQYIVDGKIRIADPFADQIADPWNDQHIPSSTYPNLVSYTDTDKGIASVIRTGQETFSWQVENFQGVPRQELMIYELLIRDFTAEHSYKSVADSIQYLKKLGVNAIELMPVNEFEGNESWGYNPSFFFAADKYYGHKDELKKLIDVAHQNGIAVIIDMVLNHAFGQNVMARMYWDDANNKPAWNNPWFNQDSPNTCWSWGSDFNHESQYTKAFMDKVTKYWQEEYKVDGFRFDFTKGFTNTQNCGWDYDASRIDILKRMADQIWTVNPNAYVILEHLTAETEENELAAYGMLPWKRVDEQYKEVISGHQLNEAAFGSAQNGGRIVYMESHDEERIMMQNLNYGADLGGYDIKDLPTALDRIEMGAAFLYTVPGPKMIWMFGEQGYDYSIDYNGRVGNKPLVWQEYMSDPNRRDVYETFSKLLNLRKDHPVFTQGYFSWNDIGDTRQIKITHETMDVVIIANFGTSTTSITPDFPHTGTWYNHFSGQEYEANGSDYVLAAGQWELFTSKKIDDSAVLAPTSLSASTNLADIKLTWIDNASNETAYIIERSTTSGTGFTTVATIGANSTSYTDSNLADGKYFYQVKAINNSNESAYSNEANSRIGEVAGLTVYIKNNANWNSVNIHYWNNIPDVLPASAWPGPNMTDEGDGWYSYTFEGVESTNLLFSNNGADKTGDMFRDKDGWNDNGIWYDTDPRNNPSNGLKIHFKPNEYTNPTIYYWATTPETTATTWPGELMTNEEDGWYTYTIDGADCSNIIFSNNGTSQTPDLEHCTEAWYDEASGVWYNNKPTPTTGLTVHFKKPTHWTSAYIHYWNVVPVMEQTTWPGNEMTAEGNDWYVYTIDGASSANIIFNNNGGEQTVDLFADSEDWYDNGWTSVIGKKLSVENGEVASLMLHQNYPNPIANGFTTLRFDLSERMDISIDIIDMTGKTIASPVNGTYNSGSHKVIFQTEKLNDGIYIMKLTTATTSISKQLIIR